MHRNPTSVCDPRCSAGSEQRSETFALFRSFRQGCPLLPLLYVLALNVLGGISLPGATPPARPGILPMSTTFRFLCRTEPILKKSAERSELRDGDNSQDQPRKACLRLGAWKGVLFLKPYLWTPVSNYNPWEVYTRARGERELLLWWMLKRSQVLFCGWN